MVRGKVQKAIVLLRRRRNIVGRWRRGGTRNFIAGISGKIHTDGNVWSNLLMVREEHHLVSYSPIHTFLCHFLYLSSSDLIHHV